MLDDMFHFNLNNNETTSTGQVRVISNLTELRKTIKRPSITKSADYKVSLQLDLYSDEENCKIERLTNDYLQSCGCKEGMLSALLFLLIGFFFRPSTGWVHSFVFLDLTLLFLIGALLGKLFTYFLKRIRIAQAIRKINKQ